MLRFLAHCLLIGCRTDVDDGQSLVRQYAVLVHVDAAPVRTAVAKSGGTQQGNATQ